MGRKVLGLVLQAPAAKVGAGMSQQYVTQRGTLTDTRPYANLDQDEREQILEDFVSIGSAETKQKWNISRQTLEHVKYYNKEALAEIEEAHFKAAGL